MKKILTLSLLLVVTLTFAQNKNQKGTLDVDGVCGMCKKRIEKACFGTKGVKYASWDVKTHQLDLIYDARKTNLKTISQAIADVGHDTKTVKATKEAYNNVHPCCKYRDEEVIEDHKKE